MKRGEAYFTNGTRLSDLVAGVVTAVGQELYSWECQGPTGAEDPLTLRLQISIMHTAGRIWMTFIAIPVHTDQWMLVYTD